MCPVFLPDAVVCSKGILELLNCSRLQFKRELYRVPFLSYWMKMLRGYSLDRQKPEESGRAYEALAEQMRGRHVLVLVHGFRNPLKNVGEAYQRLLRGLIDAG